MDIAELKLDIFRKIDALEPARLKEVYGALVNLLNTKDEMCEWNKLSQCQQEAIFKGISELDEGKGVEHKFVMQELIEKYGFTIHFWLGFFIFE